MVMAPTKARKPLPCWFCPASKRPTLAHSAAPVYTGAAFVCGSKFIVGLRSLVTARLLPQGLVLDAGDDVWICDEVPEEVVPVFGGTSRTGQHVFDFADAVIG